MPAGSIALIGVCGGDIGLGDSEPDDRGGEVTSFCDARGGGRLKITSAYRNRASPDLDWDLDEQ
jgi:hypothetical protein